MITAPIQTSFDGISRQMTYPIIVAQTSAVYSHYVFADISALANAAANT